MAQAPVKKVTINALTAGLFIGLAVLFDALKILLLFVDAIPLVGAPIGFLGSWIVSFFEFIFITVGLYIAGAYKGKNSTVNTLITMAVGAIDFIPFLDDFPFTTGEVIIIIVRSRINDELEYKAALKKYAAQQKAEKEQQKKAQRAQQIKAQVAGQQQNAVAVSSQYAQESSSARGSQQKPQLPQPVTSAQDPERRYAPANDNYPNAPHTTSYEGSTSVEATRTVPVTANARRQLPDGRARNTPRTAPRAQRNSRQVRMSRVA